MRLHVFSVTPDPMEEVAVRHTRQHGKRDVENRWQVYYTVRLTHVELAYIGDSDVENQCNSKCQTESDGYSDFCFPRGP